MQVHWGFAVQYVSGLLDLSHMFRKTLWFEGLTFFFFFYYSDPKSSAQCKTCPTDEAEDSSFPNSHISFLTFTLGTHTQSPGRLSKASDWQLRVDLGKLLRFPDHETPPRSDHPIRLHWAGDHVEAEYSLGRTHGGGSREEACQILGACAEAEAGGSLRAD